MIWYALIMYTIGWIVQIAAMVLPKLAPLEMSGGVANFKGDIQSFK